jgi:hypothetical protein
MAYAGSKFLAFLPGAKTPLKAVDFFPGTPCYLAYISEFPLC